MFKECTEHIIIIDLSFCWLKKKFKNIPSLLYSFEHYFHQEIVTVYLKKILTNATAMLIFLVNDMELAFTTK